MSLKKLFKINCLPIICRVAFLAVLPAGLALAQSALPGEARLAILREVNADGALIALALHCKHTSDDVNRLGDKLEAITMARAKAQAVALDAHTYHEAARDGFEHMRDVLRVSLPGDDSYHTQCAEAGGRIGELMAR